MNAKGYYEELEEENRPAPTLTQAPPRQTYGRYIPDNAKETTRLDLPAVVYEYTNKNGQLCAIAYAGKSKKNTWHYRFLDDSQRQRRINEFFDGIVAQEDFKNARKAEKLSFVHTLKVGDILYASWGYEQTNIDFYQVIATTAKTATVQQLKATEEATGFMCGEKMPIPGEFYGNETHTRKVQPGNKLNLSSYERAYPWDGQPKHASHYA